MKTMIKKNRTLLFIGALVLVLILWMILDNSKNEIPAKNKTQSEKSSKIAAKKAKTKPNDKKSSSVANNTNSKYIAGLLPADVYGNMNSRGFKTEILPAAGMGNLWISKMSQNNFYYEVTAWSEDDDKKVESIKATAFCDSTDNISATIQFFQMVSTLPYDNSKPQMAARWVLDNFDQNNATISIGGVKFTLFSNSKNTMNLLMENAE
jgi:hypothetical protein